MSEYLSKKAVLEWLDRKKEEDSREWEVERVGAYLNVIKEIQSGAFDADESEGTWKATSEFAFRLNDQLKAEIQHLRAALEFIEEEMSDDTSERAQRINKIISEALEGIKP